MAQPNSRGDLAARAEAIFYDALQITEATEQAAFVQATCDGDDELAGEVHRLLKAHCAANTLFSTASTALDEVDDPSEISASPLPENDPLINTSVGFYRLVKRIGEGGGGVVYLAEQEEPVRRRVALKIIKLGMDTQEVIARFEAERQALAVMDHPNIARVLEAGATATGRPYFVMEYVRGVKITEYCLEHQLDLRQRLGLFRQVCHAIQHSHQKGIIHRDIKPSNILITFEDEVPMPKVIDFGIAKATAGRVPGQTTVTAGEQIIGTPAYMSPEQLERSSMDIDTRSDIYSLGVVLAELLTGRTPFDTQELLNAGIDEMRRTLREQEPPKLSSLAKTLAAAGSPQALTIPASSLRGDLDWIVMKALEKDRNRRYQTARGLAMDVERYLAEEPVQARPPSRLYLLHKLVRRNKATFTGIAVAVIALVTGTTVSTTLYFKA
ncbi:MAG TPA: serine/threonine-protein kinase, partial [Chthoniobacteraceae bacterium]